MLIKRNKIQKFNKTIFFLFFVIGCIELFVLQNIDILIMLLISILFVEDENTNYKIFSSYMFGLIGVFTITILLYNLGILDSAYLSRVSEDGLIIQRNSLGFAHPNQLFIYFFFIMISIYYCLKKIGIKFYLLFILIGYLFYKISLCRTGFLCIFIFIFIDILKEKKNIFNNYSYLICTLLSIGICILGSDKNNFLNSVLSFRPYIGNYYIENNHIYNILGNVFNEVKFMGLTIDNMFIHTILSSGLIIWGFYFLVFWIGGKKIKNDNKLSSILLITMIYGCFETHPLNIGLNALIPVLGCILMKKGSVNHEEQKD